MGRNKVEDGHQARKILENTFFQHYLENAEKKLLAAWRDCHLQDTQGQMALKAKRDSLIEIQRDLKRYVENGERELEKQRTTNSKQDG